MDFVKTLTFAYHLPLFVVIINIIVNPYDCLPCFRQEKGATYEPAQQYGPNEICRTPSARG